ncbi:MAG: DUF6193 family natural product biosynthesis protein [Armatimonadota bacterium]
MFTEQDARAAADVENAWNRLLGEEHLSPLVQEMMKHPQLRQLFPSTSHGYLTLHQTTRFPGASSFVVLGPLEGSIDASRSVSGQKTSLLSGLFAIFGPSGQGGIAPAHIQSGGA